MTSDDTRTSDTRGTVREAWLRALGATAAIGREPRRTLPAIVDELGERFGDKTALLGTYSHLSCAALAARARRFSHLALADGIGRGDVVALMMPGSPDYIAAWIGLTGASATVALINPDLAGEALAHALRLAGPRLAIVADEHEKAVREAASGLDRPMTIRTIGSGAHSLDAALSSLSDGPIDPAARPIIADPALYIYTSGTTGLPKAAIVTHGRILEWCYWFAGLAGIGPADRLYLCLPMYHSIGGVAAPGSLLVSGGSVLIRDRFSASRFWPEIVESGCTIFQYIGELARYLLAAPPEPNERRHGLRLCLGNGLRPDIWERFRDRFAIPRILEFYAATEANVSLYNVEGEPGAIGRIPPYLKARFPIALVRHDRATGEPERAASGLCVSAAIDEPGEALGRIARAGGGEGRPFEGYTGPGDSERKILRDVLEPGDSWFRTGDLMRLDTRGFYRFVDRIGDTFRWKGENVSTTEVEAVIARCQGVRDVTVYGVAVPGADGRAGMAALVVDGSFTPEALHAGLEEALPEPARPLFVRIGREELAVTGTFKHRKTELARDGFAPDLVSDTLLFRDRTRGAFVALDADLHGAIVEGGLRL